MGVKVAPGGKSRVATTLVVADLKEEFQLAAVEIGAVMG